MTEMKEFIIDDPGMWLSQLPHYQQATIRSMLDAGLGYEQAASAWISGSAFESTAPFGAGFGMKPYFESLLDELHDFLCVGRSYEQERSELLSGFKPGQTGVAASIAAAIAPHLDAAPSYLAPAVALTLCAIGKIGLGAWCRVQSERRAGNEENPGGAPNEASSGAEPGGPS